MAESVLLDRIADRLRALCLRVAAGDDVPPAQLLRLEGLREAAVMTGCADAPALQEQMDACFREVLGEALSERLGGDWQERHPFPEVPLFMGRAPVSPGTGD